MKSGIVILFFVVAVVCAGGQQVAARRAPTFQWKASESQELGPEDRIKVSKALDAGERKDLIQAIASELRPEMKDLEIDSESELLEVAAETRVRLVDLNGDGVPGVVAQASGLNSGCGGTGNCPFWVFAKVRTEYKPLLKANTSAQVFSVRSTQTNGYFDLMLGLHDSASEETLLVYRFWNGKYRKTSCYDANWQRVNASGWHLLKEPDITPCGR